MQDLGHCHFGVSTLMGALAMGTAGTSSSNTVTRGATSGVKILGNNGQSLLLSLLVLFRMPYHHISIFVM